MNSQSNYYKREEVSEEEKRDFAFQTVNAIRESVSLAKNSTQPITYEFAFSIIHDLDEALYNSIINLLVSKNENEIVRFYKEKAEALSDDENKIDPADLIQNELNEIDEILEKKPEKSVQLKKRKFGLVAAKEYFTPRKQSEHKSLNHDFYLQSRSDFFGKPLYDSDSFKDYKISENKILRLRLLHPDNDEAILGVDLVYEHFDQRKDSVRFAHMQYKTWNTNVLYESASSNLRQQLSKMQQHLCDSKYCDGPHNGDSEYRFPYCSGFLRPTSKLQSSESKLITTGIHVPICQAIQLLESERKLTKENLKDRSIKGNIFEELFINNIAGSRWISISELEIFYESKGILSNLNNIRIHAQEVDIDRNYEEFISK